MISRFIILLLRPMFNREIRRGLRSQLNRHEVRKVIRDGWAGYRVGLMDLRPEKTLGASIMLKLAVLSRSFFFVLVSQFADENKAIDTFNKIAWKIYSKLGKVAWWFAGITKRTPYGRLKKATTLFRKFPFGPPSYLWQDDPSEANVVAFSCLRCPVAEYFKSKEMAEFGYNTWCQYDYQLAGLWGGKLELTGTIAGGAKACDFKWIVKE